MVFADAGYWIALLNVRDQLHKKAEAVAEQLGDCRIVTSQMVLVEVLNHVSRHSSKHPEGTRSLAATMVRELVEKPNIEIVPQTSSQFESATSLYSSRTDQEWSLTDCSSFVSMEEMNVWEALAHDDDFVQAGFIALLRED